MMTGEAWIALAGLCVVILGQIVFFVWKFSQHESKLETHEDKHEKTEKRLNDGDSSFKQNAITLAKMEVFIETLTKDMGEIKEILKKAVSNDKTERG